MKTWLTAKEGAAHAKVSEWTIRDAVKNGDLPAYPVGKGGRSYRVTAEDIDDWMCSRSFEPKTAS